MNKEIKAAKCDLCHTVLPLEQTREVANGTRICAECMIKTEKKVLRGFVENRGQTPEDIEKGCEKLERIESYEKVVHEILGRILSIQMHFLKDPSNTSRSRTEESVCRYVYMTHEEVIMNPFDLLHILKTEPLKLYEESQILKAMAEDLREFVKEHCAIKRVDETFQCMCGEVLRTKIQCMSSELSMMKIKTILELSTNQSK